MTGGMQWSDEGVILGVRQHGETGAVLELFTRTHGRHLGLVHGGRSRKLRPACRPGITATPPGRRGRATNSALFPANFARDLPAGARTARAALPAFPSKAALPG